MPPRAGLRPVIALAGVLLLLASTGRALALPYGAQLQDQSAFALGNYRLNVIFVESNGAIDPNLDTWTPAQITNVQNEIGQAVNFWQSQTAAFVPGARLNITVNYANGGNPVPTGYEPITRPSSTDYLWINDTLGALGYHTGNPFSSVRNFNQDQRLAGGNDWSSTLFVVNDTSSSTHAFTDGLFAYTYYGGPYTVTTYSNDGWGINRYDQVLSHELGHIFFALDEYYASGATNAQSSGYLNGINGNAQRNASGIQITAPYPNSLMLNNTLSIDPYTLRQVGIVDSDGNGIPDILQALPVITGGFTSDPATGTVQFTGSAHAGTIPNLDTNSLGFSNSGSAMTIDRITGAAYQLDGGAWTGFPAADGGYGDDPTEALTLGLTGLPAGPHTLVLRATDDLGQTDVPGAGGGTLSFQFTSAIAPEPATAALTALALAGLATALARRRR